MLEPRTYPTHGKRGGLLFDALLSLVTKQVGAGKDKRILLVLDQAGWHAGR
jgi:hypothetical protein